MGTFNTIPPNPFPPSSEQQGNGGGSQYELPIASAETLGGVKVGTGLSIDGETGELSNTNPTPYTPPTYSTTEQATGKKWIDGKDIFVRVFDLGSDVSIGSSSYTDTNIDASGISKIIDAKGMQSNGTYKLINASCDATYVKISSPFSSDTVRYITLYYTKTESEVI